MLWYVMLYYIILCCKTNNYTILYYTISFYIVLNYYIILYRMRLHCGRIIGHGYLYSATMRFEVSEHGVNPHMWPT